MLHLEKTDPPARTDALRTAARAVLTILADERSLGDGAWAEAMRDWQDAPSVVRRRATRSDERPRRWTASR
ncbi:hypothetical protein SCALM49S_02399 [Streptomyces californicus]